MFVSSRVEKINGFKFYEKDIIYLEYTFNDDVEINIQLDYVNPGFGVALIDHEGSSLAEKKFSYLAKIGHKEASIFYADKFNKEILDAKIVPNIKTIYENMNFKLIKKGKRISIHIEDKEVSYAYIKNNLSKFHIGIYSNLNNTVKNISVISGTPNGWVVNMKNSKGGFVKFLNNSFELYNCNIAELGQSNISLKAGTYYIKYDKELINDINDIKVYIQKSNDNRFFDDEKNILSNNSFKLLKEESIDIKFVGSQGKISNITIVENLNDNYISTALDNFSLEGSYIAINLKNIKNISWKGIINNIPELLTSNDDYFIITQGDKTLKPAFCNIMLHQEYIYKYDAISNIFEIYKDNAKIYEYKFNSYKDKIYMFKNMSSIIKEFKIIKTNNEIIDLIYEESNIRFISANINSPIIAVDEENNPIDLSSSFRNCIYKDYNKFIFTNYEREYFNPNTKIQLTRKASSNKKIYIYGIPKAAKYNMDKIYDVNNKNINSIDLFSNIYNDLTNNIEFIDYINNIIYLKEFNADMYSLIVIDYMKNDSYCINYNFDKLVYEVEINSDKKINLLYNTIAKDNISIVNDFKITNIPTNIDGYVVIRKE